MKTERTALLSFQSKLNCPCIRRELLKFKLTDQNLSLGKNCAIRKGQKTIRRILWQLFCQQPLALKLDCQRAAILTSAGVLWLLFVLFLTILRRIQSTIFESSVRRRQNCIDNLIICVNFAKNRFCWRPFDRVDRQQRRLRKECTVSSEREND